MKATIKDLKAMKSAAICDWLYYDYTGSFQDRFNQLVRYYDNVYVTSQGTTIKLKGVEYDVFTLI